jgi:host factor-I protein
MAFSRHHHFRKNRHDHTQHFPRHDRHEYHARHDHYENRAHDYNRRDRLDQYERMNDRVHPDDTGAEAAYLKSLVDSHAKVTVVLTDGERLHGFIRYYDRQCFSLGLSAEGPRIFLRKASVSYIAEE